MSDPAQSGATPQMGWAIWLTGLPASGKTTIARQLQQQLRARQTLAVILDSDALRPVLAPASGYDEAGRDDFYARLVGLAELLVAQGVNVIIAATANRRAHRDVARLRLPRFAEVWVKCSLEVCRRRDPKGLYARALAGEIENLPGVQVAYEEPLAPDLILDSDHQTPEEATDALLSLPFFRQI